MKKRMVLGIYGNIIIKNAVPWYFTSILCNKPIIVPWSFTFHELQNGGVVLCKGGTLVQEILKKGLTKLHNPKKEHNT